MARVVKHTVRLSKDEQGSTAGRQRARVCSNPAFIRAAIRNELTGRESEVAEAEQRTSATLDHLSRDLFAPTEVSKLSLPVRTR